MVTSWRNDRAIELSLLVSPLMKMSVSVFLVKRVSLLIFLRRSVRAMPVQIRWGRHCSVAGTSKPSRFLAAVKSATLCARDNESTTKQVFLRINPV